MFQLLRLARSKGPNRVSSSPLLKTQFPKRIFLLFRISDDGQVHKFSDSETPFIINVKNTSYRTSTSPHTFVEWCLNKIEKEPFLLRESERESGGGNERHYSRRWVDNNNFLFEGSQALPVSPSDKGEA
jgi:hypothetical protein